MHKYLFLLLFLFSVAPGKFAFAQDYPTRPIRFVVPFPASGGGDIIIRALSQRLSERLGQAVVVDNRSGASGNVGTEIVARAAAQVNTISMAAQTVINSMSVSAVLSAAGIAPCGSTPAEFRQFIVAELNRWKLVVARFSEA